MRPPRFSKLWKPRRSGSAHPTPADPPLSEYPVRARHLTVRVGWRKTLIADISLAVKQNELMGLIGGSGSGKTTLLTCLNGFRRPSEGSVTLNGVPGDRADLAFRRLIGYVPQDDVVHRTLTAERALHYAARLRLPPDTPAEKIDFRVGKILYQLDLRNHGGTKIGRLSGGQRKRVNIGVELIHRPRLLFLDEPTAGLDPGLERGMMRLLSEMAKRGRTVVMTTHLMQHAHLFDVLAFIHGGRLAYFGPSDEITDFFGVRDLIELFEATSRADPLALQNRYRGSAHYRRHLEPRLAAAGAAHGPTDR